MKLTVPLFLLFVLSAVAAAPAWSQQPPGQSQPSVQQPAQQPEADDDRPIGVRLSEAAADFTKAIQAAERGQADVEDAQAEVDRLQADLAAAQASTTTAGDALDGLHDDTRTAGDAVIELIREYLAGLPD